MSVAIEKNLITIDEFVAMPEAHDHELIDGQLVEQKPMGAESSLVAGTILSVLNAYLSANPLGWAFGADTVYQCFRRPNTGKKPDVSFVRRGRFEGERIPRGYIKLAPDLAVEVISPHDLAYEVTEKLEAYLSAGVRLIWVVFPNTRTVEVVRLDRSSIVLSGHEELGGEDVLPGFAVQVANLFPPVENVEPWPQP